MKIKVYRRMIIIAIIMMSLMAYMVPSAGEIDYLVDSSYSYVNPEYEDPEDAESDIAPTIEEEIANQALDFATDMLEEED